MNKIQSEITALLKGKPLTGRALKTCLRSDIILIRDNLNLMLISGRVLYNKGFYSLPEKKSKYNNIKPTVDGHKFDSKKEAGRYLELRLLERIGKITDLELQPPFKYYEGDKYIFTYKGDFKYVQNSVIIIEDVKSKHTAKIPLYRLKKRN